MAITELSITSGSIHRGEIDVGPSNVDVEKPKKLKAFYNS